MNIRNVLRTYSLLRQLTDDETALLETLRSMSDTDRESLVVALQPEKPATKKTETRKIEKCEACNYTRRALQHVNPAHTEYHEFVVGEKASKKSSVSSKSETERVFKRCETCGLTKRADVHKDSELGGYHDFREKKSERATNLHTQLKSRVSEGREAATRDGESVSSNGIVLCGASLASSGLNCNLPQGHALHADKGYVDYHPFRPSTTASTATTPSPANGGTRTTTKDDNYGEDFIAGGVMGA